MSRSLFAWSRHWQAAAVAAASFAAVPAVANPFELYGAGAHATSVGQTMAGWQGDAAALWHNPAAMAGAAPSFSMGALFALDHVAVQTKARPAGYELPDFGAASKQIPSKYRLNPVGGSDDITDVKDFLLSAVGSFGFRDLRVGVTVALPMTRLGMQNSRFADEREQYASNRLQFELLGARSQHQVIVLGTAWQALPWLSLGAAMSIMPRAEATSDVYLQDPARQQDVRLAASNEQLGRVAPIFGIYAQPHRNLRAGVGYRGANQFDLNITNRIQINGFQSDPKAFPVMQHVGLVLNYTPAQVDAGASLDLDAFRLAADAVFSRWSQYLDTEGEKPDPGFKDTVSIRLGGEYQASSERVLRAGLQWEPTPVPAQTGRSNYVDNNRIVAAVGGGHKLRLFEKPVELGWSLALHHLLARDTNKQLLTSFASCTAQPRTNQLCDEVPDTTLDPQTGKPAAAAQGLQTGNPGFPGFTSGGQILVIGVNLRWDL